MRKLIFLIPLLLEGCYGTFRTAEVLEPRRQAVDVNCAIWDADVYDNVENTTNMCYFPTIHYRRGMKKGEWGIKLYYVGIEPTLCLPLVRDALALEMGIGTMLYVPVFGELNFITSKHMGSVDIYGGEKLIIGVEEYGFPCSDMFMLARLYGGINIGVIFLEASYGGHYEIYTEWDGKVFYGAVYGVGIRAFSWGGKKTKVQKRDNIELKK